MRRTGLGFGTGILDSGVLMACVFALGRPFSEIDRSMMKGGGARGFG